MTVTTWTLTGDVSDLAGDDWPTTGSAKAEAYLTAYDADGPCKFYVDTATGGKVRFGPTIPVTLASDGTFTVAGIPDSSETGLSYTFTLTYRPAGHGRTRAETTDRFTLDANKALNQVGFQDPTISPAVVLANAVDAVMAPIVSNETSQTNIALEAEIAEAFVSHQGGRLRGSLNGLAYDGTDESAAMQALLDAAAALGAVTIELEGTVRCDSQLNITTSVVGTQRRQPPLRITGTAAHSPGSALSSVAYPTAPGLDLRYAGRTDAGCTTTLGSVVIDNAAATAADRGNLVTGAGIPDQCWILAVSPGVGWTVSKAARATGSVSLTSMGGRFQSFGYGILEIDHLQIVSGAATTAPFFLSTATTVRCHDNLFQGASGKTGATCDEDPWVFGGYGQGVMLTSGLTSGNTYTSLTVSALPVGIMTGQAIVINKGAATEQSVTTSSAVAAGATSIPVSSFTASADHAARSSVAIANAQVQTSESSWNVAAGLFQGYISELRDNHFHACRRISVGGFASDLHITRNAWMHNCGSNLAAIPSTLTSQITSGATVTSLAVTALSRAILAGDTVQIDVSDADVASSQEAVAAADAAVGATTISVTSFTANATYAVGTKVYNTTAGIGAMIESYPVPNNVNTLTVTGNRFGFSGAYNYATRFTGVTNSSHIRANNNQDTGQNSYPIASHRFDRGAEYNLVAAGLVQTIPTVDDWSVATGKIRQTILDPNQSRPSRFPQGLVTKGDVSSFTSGQLPVVVGDSGNQWRPSLTADGWELKAYTPANGWRTVLYARIASGTGYMDMPAVTNGNCYLRNPQGHFWVQSRAAYKLYLGDATYPSSTYVDKGALHTAACAPAAVATASRPAANLHGAGSMVYDTTLSKPIWSDGSVWRDAAGTAV